MNEKEAKKHIQALKAFHGHLWTYAVFMACLAIVNFMTYLRGDTEIWVIYPLVFWGAAVLLQGVTTYRRFGRGRKWEEQKLRELTGWSASEEELVRLARRVDALLSILSADDDEALGPALKGAKQRLLDAKNAIEHYRSPLDDPRETDLSKRDVLDIVEQLELVLTRREFQRVERARTVDPPRRRTVGES